jgi:hypothetical protein
VLIATIDVLSTPTVTPNTGGWSVVTNTTAGTAMRHLTYVRVAGSTEPTSYTWSWSGRQGASGGIAAYQGVDRTTPVDAFAASASTTSSTSIVAPSVTTTKAGDALVGSFGIATNPTFTPPAGMDERFEVAGTSLKVGSSLDDQMLSAASSTGSRTATSSKAAVSVGATIALRAAASSTPGDTQAPSVPQNLRLVTAASATQVQLAWDASTDDVAVDHYLVYRNGVALATSATTTYTDATVVASSQYQYTVTAFDAAGNESTQSGQLTVTTPALTGIAFRAASQASASATTLSLAKPTGTQTGDVLLATLDVKGAPTITAPDGWSLVGQVELVGSTTSHATYWHAVTASDVTPYVWSFSTKSASVGVVLAYAGVNTSAPIAATAATVTSTTATSLTAPSLSASTGQVLVAFFGTTVSASVTPPTGMTERAEVSSGAGKIDLEGSDRSISSSGGTGALSATLSKASSGVGRSLLLTPA